MPTSPSPSYKTYVSPEWWYSLGYPASWYSFPVQPSSESATTKAFSNQDTESYEGLGSDGVLVALTVDPEDLVCSVSGPKNDPRVTSTPIVLDGVQTTEWFYLNGIGVTVAHANWCYRFSLLTISPETRDKFRAEADHMLSTFRFNR